MNEIWGRGLIFEGGRGLLSEFYGIRTFYFNHTKLCGRFYRESYKQQKTLFFSFNLFFLSSFQSLVPALLKSKEYTGKDSASPLVVSCQLFLRLLFKN